MTGGTHGVGVIKVDSIPGLRSLIDYVNAVGSKAILRKFINHTSQGRFVVIGNKVVASDMATMSITYDFRSNIDEDKTRIWEAHTYDKEIENLAIQAVNSFEMEF
ncbi:hypothetical protein FACS189428_1490 [Clostridia bacterium]|nr:hypothetical protein FACS189428_1490 [Clostridia bacterium]